jgi:hypothetical protein
MRRLTPDSIKKALLAVVEYDQKKNKNKLVIIKKI